MDTEQHDKAHAQGPGIMRRFSEKLYMVMSEENGYFRKLYGSTVPSSGLYLAELNR